MRKEQKTKRNMLPTVLLLAVIITVGIFPGNYINAWASEIVMETSVSENDIVESEPEAEPEAEPENLEEVSDVSGNEVPVTEEVVSEDTVSGNETTESNVIVQEFALSVEDEAKEIFNIELPTLAENSIFNYILDPQGIITATDAVLYGSVPFEEGATLFFENTEGAFGLSSRSDMLEVTNKSTTAVKISVYAQVTPVNGVVMTSDRAFEDESTSLYLALVSEDGTEIPIGTGEEAVLVKEMKAVEEDAFDSFSFGLTGACNPKGNWRFVKSIPEVTVTWKIEPLYD